MTKKESDKKSDKDEKIAELTDVAKRVQADFENYKKRTEKEQQNYISLGKVLVLKQILPVLDTLDNAQDNKELVLVRKQLMDALAGIGLKPIEVLGKRFDPYKHACIAEVSCEKPKGTVAEELQRGYLLNDMLLRHASVKVSKGKDDNKQEDAKRDCAEAGKPV